MEPKDIFGGKAFIATFRYPKLPDLPRMELGSETRETEDPFRVGMGVVFRIPFTRLAVVIGVWVRETTGKDEESKIRNALQGHDLEIPTSTIKEW